MNTKQAAELKLLLDTVRHVDKMDVFHGAVSALDPDEGCLLCEGVRHNLYTVEEGRLIDMPEGFAPHFGCTIEEAHAVLFHYDARHNGNFIAGATTTGENYYQAGMELLTKYGYNTEASTQSFAEIMSDMRAVTA